jgi:hypothetical protein
MLFTFISCSDSTRDNIDGDNPINEYSIHDTIYEDAEDGTIDRWEELNERGIPIQNVEIGANGSNRSIFLRDNWRRDNDGNYIKDENGFPINDAHYELPIHNNHQFILEFDKMKKEADITYCFTIGVKLDTKDGERHISFNPFYDKEDMEANAQWILDGSVKELVFPLSMDYVDITNVWEHLRFDLVDYLNILDPGNEIIEVTAFYFQGGDDYLDNIQFSSE